VVDATGDWAALGVALPTDYRELVPRYGSGVFCDHVVLLAPFGLCTLLDHGVALLDDDREFRDGHDDLDADDYLCPLHPEPGGLLVWATTTTGARLCWLTAGAPDDWPVIAWDPKGFEYEEHPPGAVAFLAGWLGGGVATDLLPPAPPAPWFEPPRVLDQVYLRLTEGPLPHEERLRVLRAALAPTQDRGGVVLDDGSRQDHFATATWRVTYETAYGHQVRVSYPKEDEARARTALTRAVELMGCAAESVTDPRGHARWAG
jgi:hypothetical protein